MKSIHLCLLVLCLREASAGVARKQPQYAKPVYSDSYIPAAMQVIFYAVEQIKTFPQPEASTILPTTLPHAPGQHQPAVTTSKPTVMPTMQTQETATSQAAVTAHETSQLIVKPETSTSERPITTEDIAAPSQEPAIAEESSTFVTSEKVPLTSVNPESSSAPNILATSPPQKTPDVSNETPEAVYATPEMNHETPETFQETPEVNQEISSIHGQTIAVASNEGMEVDSEGAVKRTTVQMTPIESSTKGSSSEESSSSSEESKEDNHRAENVDKKGGSKDKGKESKPTIDSVVQEIYGIVKKTGRKSSEESGSSESKEKKEKFKGEDGGEVEEDEGQEEDDEIRFSQLGEKVFQVPRPSLLTYLKRARITLRCSLEQLAILYDALSKDARRQGFVKFSGYSDRVLKTLETSAEGGVGPQLQLILEKIIQRNELTRDDTKARVAEAIKDLKQPGSTLNRDLRRLLPLNFKM